MSLVATDIIVPVWGGPVETRECLAALVANTAPHARLILLDPGCDPETDQVLHEFAEFLDDRVILLYAPRSVGLVETLNRGLALASAPLVVALRSSSIVAPGWLEPLQSAADGTDVGILVPCTVQLEDGPRRGQGSCHRPVEASHGSFAAIGITARLYREAGGFDAGLDGGELCLRDYSRRAWKAGFRTVCVDGPPIRYRDEVVYGSPERRERLMSESRNTYLERWGEENSYCLCLSLDPGRDAVDRIFAAALDRARNGVRFFVLAPFRAHRTIVAAGLHRLHSNIAVERLSRWFPARALASAFSALRKEHPELQPVTGADGLSEQGGVAGIGFGELEHHRTVGEV